MKKFLAFTLVFALAIALTGCSKDQEDKDNQQTQEDVNEQQDEDIANQDKEDENKNNQADTSEDTDNQQIEKEPFSLDVELPDGRGNMVNLSDYANGKLLFVNFFATWCGPCMEEMPEFQEVYNEYSDKLEIVIVNIKFQERNKTMDDIVAWYDDAGYTFPMVIDEEGKELREFYPYIQGIPTTFIYSPDGTFLDYITGAMNKEQVLYIIEHYGGN